MTSRQLVAVLALLSAAAFVSESEGSAVSLTPDDKVSCKCWRGEGRPCVCVCVC